MINKLKSEKFSRKSRVDAIKLFKSLMSSPMASLVVVSVHSMDFNTCVVFYKPLIRINSLETWLMKICWGSGSAGCWSVAYASVTQPWDALETNLAYLERQPLV